MDTSLESRYISENSKGRVPTYTVPTQESRRTQGIVTVPTRGINQDGIEVMSFERTMLVHRRGHPLLPFDINQMPSPRFRPKLQSTPPA